MNICKKTKGVRENDKAEKIDFSAGNDHDFCCCGFFLPGLIGAGNLDAPVEKTGQTGCWDESGTSRPCTGTGQDGELQKGVSWPVPRFTDNADGTVTDNLTGLIWLKNANCPNTTTTWIAALTFCNALFSGICGLTDGSVAGDWRLPNVKELQSLIDYGSFMPALPSGYPFTGVQSDLYWSSTFWANTATAWYVSVGDGNVFFIDKVFYPDACVWPVRDGVSDGGGGSDSGCFITTTTR